jgi:hypothetical protein
VPTFCTMNGVTQPFVPPSIFVMFGRKIVVVGTPGVPHGAAGAAAADATGASAVTVGAACVGGDATPASAGPGAATSVSASSAVSARATLPIAASMRALTLLDVLSA